MSAKKYWLLKNELADYSIADMARDKRTLWTGVRNYQARNFMSQGMNLGDLAIFYSSNPDPSGAVGVVRISKNASADPTALDKKSKYYDPKSTPDKPIWECVEVEYQETFKRMVSIQEMRTEKSLKDLMILQKGSRLSITPLTEKEFLQICKMGSESYILPIQNI